MGQEGDNKWTVKKKRIRIKRKEKKQLCSDGVRGISSKYGVPKQESSWHTHSTGWMFINVCLKQSGGQQKGFKKVGKE